MLLFFVCLLFTFDLDACLSVWCEIYFLFFVVRIPHTIQNEYIVLDHFLQVLTFCLLFKMYCWVGITVCLSIGLVIIC